MSFGFAIGHRPKTKRKIAELKSICRGTQEIRPPSTKESISTIHGCVDLEIKEYQGQPAPVFRARAITLASTSPPRLNFCDLKNDVNAGPVCWNPGNVQAWDVRSYKAAQWVLRNWKMLIS